MAKNASTLSTMVGENLEIYCSQMPKMHPNCPCMEKILKFSCSQIAKNASKLSTMVGENFEIYCAQMAKNASKLSMAGVKFEIYCYQMAKNASKLSTMV